MLHAAARVHDEDIVALVGGDSAEAVTQLIVLPPRF